MTPALYSIHLGCVDGSTAWIARPSDLLLLAHRCDGLGPHRDILSTASITQMRTRSATTTSSTGFNHERYGLGWYTNNYSNLTSWSYPIGVSIADRPDLISLVGKKWQEVLPPITSGHCHKNHPAGRAGFLQRTELGVGVFGGQLILNLAFADRIRTITQFMHRLLIAAVILGCVPMASAEDAGMSDQKFDELRSELAPAPKEPWRTIPWKIALLDAQRQAARERKLIFIWAMDGHPLGCT